MEREGASSPNQKYWKNDYEKIVNGGRKEIIEQTIGKAHPRALCEEELTASQVLPPCAFDVLPATRASLRIPVGKLKIWVCSVRILGY